MKTVTAGAFALITAAGLVSCAGTAEQNDTSKLNGGYIGGVSQTSGSGSAESRSVVFAHEGDFIAYNLNGAKPSFYRGTFNAEGGSLVGDASNMANSEVTGGNDLSGNYVVGSETALNPKIAMSNSSSEFAVARESKHDENSSFGEVDGQWSVSGISISVNENGTLSGSNSANSCSYSGNIGPADTNINLYKVDVNLSGCNDSTNRNGDYTGYASKEFNGIDDTLVILVSKSDNKAYLYHGLNKEQN